MLEYQNKGTTLFNFIMTKLGYALKRTCIVKKNSALHVRMARKKIVVPISVVLTVMHP